MSDAKFGCAVELVAHEACAPRSSAAFCKQSRAPTKGTNCRSRTSERKGDVASSRPKAAVVVVIIIIINNAYATER